MIPGQSLSPRCFWEQHIQVFIDNNINVILVDPIGYGNSLCETLPHNYSRDFMHEQLMRVYDIERTKENVVLGFCSTTANALKSAEFGVDKIIILGPSILESVDTISSTNPWFHNTKQNLIAERFNKISDKLVPKDIGNFRYDGWDIDVPDSWSAPALMIHDIRNYYAINKTHNIDFSKCKSVLGIIGEYDYEPQATGGLSTFKILVPNSNIYRLKNSTHFSMWEHNYQELLNKIVRYINDN